MGDKPQLVWLDLCSGLGGASQPALDRGWKVIRVDIDPRFKPDIVADVRNLPLKPFHVDVLWASPPCVEFARLAMPWQRKRYPDLKEPDLSICAGSVCAILELNPSWWIFENTTHARRWLRTSPLSGLLGPVRARIAGHYLWGKLPGLLPDGQRAPKESLWPREGRAAERAKIPYAIGEAVCLAVERRIHESDIETVLERELTSDPATSIAKE